MKTIIIKILILNQFISLTTDCILIRGSRPSATTVMESGNPDYGTNTNPLPRAWSWSCPSPSTYDLLVHSHVKSIIKHYIDSIRFTFVLCNTYIQTFANYVN